MLTLISLGFGLLMILAVLYALRGMSRRTTWLGATYVVALTFVVLMGVSYLEPQRIKAFADAIQPAYDWTRSNFYWIEYAVSLLYSVINFVGHYLYYFIPYLPLAVFALLCLVAIAMLGGVIQILLESRGFDGELGVPIGFVIVLVVGYFIYPGYAWFASNFVDKAVASIGSVADPSPYNFRPYVPFAILALPCIALLAMLVFGLRILVSPIMDINGFAILIGAIIILAMSALPGLNSKVFPDFPTAANTLLTSFLAASALMLTHHFLGPIFAVISLGTIVMSAFNLNVAGFDASLIFNVLDLAGIKGEVLHYLTLSASVLWGLHDLILNPRDAFAFGN